ncbi:MAG: hypothetical protein ACK5LM_01250 [Lactovum sp.]
MIKKQLKIVGLCLLLLTVFFSTIVQASKSEKIKLTIELEKDGLALVHRQIMGENLTIVYEKIKNADFSEEELNSSQWQAMRQNYAMVGNSISLTSDLKIAPGNPLSESESQEALKILFSESKVSQDFLNFLNDSNIGVTGGKISNSSQFFFKDSENIGKSLTDEQGKAEAELSSGYYAILDGGKNWLAFTHLTKEKTLKLDLSNLESTGLSLEITNLSKDYQNNVGQYVVEYGEEIIYQLKVSKELLTSETTVALHPKTNLVIDSISVPFEISSLLANPLRASNYGLAVNENTLSAVESQKDLEAILYNRSIQTYSFSLPESQEDIVIEIKGHLEAEVEIKTLVEDLSSEELSLIMTEKRQDYSTSFTLPVSLSNINTTESFISKDRVMSSGINFVLADSESNQLLSSSVYLLGKKKGNKSYLYKSDGTWEEVNQDLKNIDSSVYQRFEGNFSYKLGVEEGEILETVTNRSNYNQENETKINQSIFQLRGLNVADDYFLYQIVAAEGYDKNESLYSFEIYSNQKYSGSGSLFYETSISNASFKSQEINSLLSDYNPGVQDYHLIDVNSETKVKSKTTFILLVIVVVILVLTALAVLIIKIT